MSQFTSVEKFKAWFEAHVALGGKPYTLDLDQAKAVLDQHQNTLVTARAGSGKTRVIVAKVAYLVANRRAELSEIAAFMFNRTAAAEVNERIGAVEVDGVPLSQWHGQAQPIRTASTFHKFALDVVKAFGVQPELISEAERSQIIRQGTAKILAKHQCRLPAPERIEILRLVSSFIARAGQQFLGEQGLAELRHAVETYCEQRQHDAACQNRIFIHQVALAAYEDYLRALDLPKIDFNLLMARAARCLYNVVSGQTPPSSTSQRIARFKFLLVDEYQDFSFLFFNLIRAIRGLCPVAHLFAVGDDWQAINRFAGSDVDYFINFAKYFPTDVVNIPLMTNYRSDRHIVENANRYMLKNYNPQARPAVAFSHQNGKIKYLNPVKTKFDTGDLLEDALGDAQFQLALARCADASSPLDPSSPSNASTRPSPAGFQKPAQLLKTVYKIVKKHHKEQVLLLHRHNFTSFANVDLANFYQALRQVTLEEGIMDAAKFDRQVRCMTMHKSKGLESDVVILLEANRDQIRATHPHATIFELFGDTRSAEIADQHRLLYVALTRAKHKLYILSSDKKPVL